MRNPPAFSGRTRVLLFAFLTAAVPGCTAAPSGSPFAASVGWPTGFPARALAVLDGDAGQVALAFQLEDQVGLLDAGDGELVPWAAPVGASPTSLAVLELGASRGLATANTGDATLTLVDGSPAGLTVRATASLSLRPKHVTAADLDGDGRDEAVVTLGLEGEAGAGVEVWRAGDDALAPFGPRWTLDGAFSTAAGDVDGDGDADVVAVLPSRGSLAWAANDGSGRLGESARFEVCASPRRAVLLADRIAVACQDGLALVRGVASSPVVEHIPVGGNLYDVAAGDFDGDGRADVAAVDVAGDAVLLFHAREDGELSAPSRSAVGIDPIALVSADLGGDGDLDLIVSAFGSRTIDVLVNQLVPSERTSP